MLPKNDKLALLALSVGLVLVSGKTLLAGSPSAARSGGYRLATGSYSRVPWTYGSSYRYGGPYRSRGISYSNRDYNNQRSYSSGYSRTGTYGLSDSPYYRSPYQSGGQSLYGYGDRYRSGGGSRSSYGY